MSTFAELYSDFKDSVKVYTQKLDLTPLMFMRRITRAAQVFQRESELVETLIPLTRANTSVLFQIPDDFLREVELRDSEGHPILILKSTQLNRINDQITATGINETPASFSYRITPYDNDSPKPMTTTARMATIYGKDITLSPDSGDLTLSLWYIPDIQTISETSNQWVAWYPWNTNHESQFVSTGLPQQLTPYERGILNFAIAEYLRSLGSKNYQDFMFVYKEELQMAKINKPTRFKEGRRDYYMAPRS